MQVTDKMVEVAAEQIYPTWQSMSETSQRIVRLDMRRALTAALAHREAEAVQVDANAIAENELQEIADGAWGDNPAVRGAARDRLAALIPPAQEAVAAQIADTVLNWMVKYDLLDAGNEYGPDDVLAVLNDLAPVESVTPPAVPAGMVREECATEGCDHPATVHFERGGIGSHYCHACYMRVQALTAAQEGR